jgi:RHS repeat-associated protein
MPALRRWAVKLLPAVLVAPVLAIAPLPDAAGAAFTDSAYWWTVAGGQPAGWWRVGDAGSDCDVTPCVLDNEVGSGDGHVDNAGADFGYEGLADRGDDAVADAVGEVPVDSLASEEHFSVEFWADNPTIEGGTASFSAALGAGPSSNTTFLLRGEWGDSDAYHSRIDAQLDTGDEDLAVSEVSNPFQHGVHHLVLVYEEPVLALFLDGEVVGTDSGGGDLSWVDAPAMAIEGADGLDEVAVYNRALSNAEVRDHWHAGLVSGGHLWKTGSAAWTPWAGDPVDAASGNLIHDSEVALPAAAGAYGLDWSATYNSLDPASGLLGRGWSHSFNSSVTPLDGTNPDEGDVLFRAPDGRLSRFVNTATNVWISPDEIRGELSFADDEFTLTYLWGEEWVFDPEGWLVAMNDGQGQSVAIDRDETGVVEWVANDAADRRIAVDDSVTDEVTVGSEFWDGDSWEPDGRELTYTLTDGELARVDGPGGAAERYTMDAGQMTDVESLVEAGDPGVWVPVISNVFDEDGRVVEQTTASGSETRFEYGVPDEGQTTVTHDPDGNPLTATGEQELIHSYDPDGRLTGITDPDAEATEQSWVDGQLASFTDRRDAQHLNVYEDGVLTFRVYPDPDSGEIRPDVLTYGATEGVSGEAPNDGDGDIFEAFTYVAPGDPRLATYRSRGGETTTYTYDGSETVPEVVEKVDTAPDPDVVLERTCAVSADGLVTKVVEGADEADCDPATGEVVTDFYYGSSQPAGSSVADCPPRLLCVSAVADDGSSGQSGDETWTVYTYDTAGRVATATEAYGRSPGGGSPGATTTKYVYDTAGRVTRVFDPIAWADWAPDSDFDGTHYATDYGYDPAGRLLWVSGPDNPYTGDAGYPSTAYTYTADGQVETERTYLDTSIGTYTQTTSHYDPLGQLTAVDEADGTGDEAVTAYTYGPLGRVDTMTTAAGTGDAVVTRYDYDADGNVIHTVVDPDDGSGDPELSLVTATGYDAAGEVACEAHGAGWVISPTEELDCGPAGHEIGMGASSGTFGVWVTSGSTNCHKTSLAYNISTSSLQAALDDCVPSVTVTGTAGDTYQLGWGDGEYHRAFLEQGTLNGDGAVLYRNLGVQTVYERDEAGRVVRQIEAPEASEQTTTEYVYDTAGRLSQTLRETGVVEDASGMRPWRFGVVEERDYDTAGRLVHVTTPPPDVQTFTWNPANGVVATTGYDDAGRVETLTTAEGETEEVTVTSSYDAHGWLLARSDPADPGLEATFAYDGLGRVVGESRPFGDNDTTSRLTAYTPTGQVAAQTDFADTPVIDTTPTRHYGYNAAGWLTSVVDANGTTALHGYDLRGNRTSTTATQDLGAAPDCEPAGTMYCITETWAFDDNDHQTAHTFPRDDSTASTVTTGYDAAGRLTERSEPIGDGVDRTATYTYWDDQLVGSVAMAVTGGPSLEVGSAFDLLGRRTVAATYDGEDYVETRFTYDRAGRLVAEDNPSGPDVAWGWAINGTPRYQVHTNTFRYTHDNQGRLTETAVQGFASMYAPLAAYEYDDAGRPLREVYANNGDFFVDFDRDDAGNITEYSSDLNGTNIHEYTLEWGFDGRVAHECEDTDDDDACGGGDKVTDDDYLYDPAGQLRGQGPGCEWTGSPAEPDGDCDATWTYDGAGNRTHHTAGAASVDYVVNEANQVLEAATAGGNTLSFTYNWAGDRITRDEVDDEDDPVDYQEYGWGPDGKLATITGDNWFFGDYFNTYTRDATGNLVHFEADFGIDDDIDATRDFVWDPTMPVPQIIDGIIDGTTHRVQGYGLRRIIQIQTLGFYSYDWLDNVIDSTNFPDNPTDYSPYGEPEGLTSLAFYFGYRSEFSAGGQVHLRNREYDSSTGTFLSRDPASGVDGTTTIGNDYHYTGNDPLNKVDPLGLRPEDDEFGEPDLPDPTPDTCGVSTAPPFLASGSGYGGAASAQLAQFRIPVDYCKGVVRMNFYIAADEVELPHGTFAGDGRPAMAQSTAWDSRASFELDFTRGLGRLFVNYTCGTRNGLLGHDFSCHDALTIGMGPVNTTTPVTNSGFNELDVRRRDGEDELELRWKLSNPMEGTILGVKPCGITGQVTFDLGGEGSSLRLEDKVFRDFPSIEVYQFAGGRTITHENRTEGNPLEICALR